MAESLRAARGRSPEPTGSRSARAEPAARLPFLSLTLWFTLVALWLTWVPFAVRPDPNPLRWPSLANPVDLLGNLVLLAPLAVAVALGSGRRPVATALAACALVSLVIEAGQLFLASRITSPVDVALNALGGAGAAALAVRGRGRLGEGRILAWVAALVFVGLAGEFVLGGYVAGERVRIARWDPAFQIVAADEVGGMRRYAGEVRDARICAGVGAERVCATAGAGPGLRERLARAAERSQRVEVEARVLSTSDAQRGPARIVTFSRGTDIQNLMLGQDGTALVLRVLTPRVQTGGYASGPELSLPGAVRAGEATEVRAVFDRGRIRIESRSAARTASGTFAYSALTSGILGRPNLRVTPGHFVSAAVAGAVVLFFPLGLLVRRLFPGGRSAWMLAAVAAAGVVHLLHLPGGVGSGALPGLAAIGASLAGSRTGAPNPVDGEGRG